MKSCKEYRKDINDLFDNELKIDEKKLLEEHLKECKECNEYFKKIKSLRALLSNLPTIGPSENFNILLREKIRREDLKQKTVYSSSKRLYPVFAIGISILIIAFISVKNINILNNKSISVKNESQLKSTFTSENKKNNIQYVIEQYNDNSGNNKKPGKSIDENLQDSLKTIKNLNHLKGRLTPVSF